MSKRDCSVNGKLEHALKHEFFVQHLPYRISQLLAFQRWKNELRHLVPVAEHRRFAPCHVESSALMARAFLHLLGISFSTKSGKLTRPTFREDDLTALDLHGCFARIDSIPVKDQEILKRVLIQTNKATAHITWSDYPMDGWQCLPEAIEVIMDLLQTHLYIPAGYPISDHWRTPSEFDSDRIIESEESSD